MKNKHYYPVAHSLDIEEIISIMCEEPSTETFARMDEEFLPLTDFTQKDRRASRRKATAKHNRRDMDIHNIYYNSHNENICKCNKEISVGHSYRHAYSKPESVSKAKYENGSYRVERPYQFYTEDEHERCLMFNAYCQDYLDCGDDIEPRDTEGYLIHVGEYSFYVYSPAEARYYLN